MATKSSIGGTKVLLLIADHLLQQQTQKLLEEKGLHVFSHPSSKDVEEVLQSLNPHLIVCDLQTPGLNWKGFLSAVKENSSPAPLILLTRSDSVTEAMEALKDGAYDCIRIPYHPLDFTVRIHRALEEHRVKQEVQNLKREIDYRRNSDYIVGTSRPIQHLLGRILVVSDKDISVLIEGESGTGKELVARAIHYNSSRAKQPFVAVNCAAIPDNLIENELFGHEKGAYTGADALKQGLFEQADQGTIFLDEVGELGRAMQAKFLRVLETGEVRRLGGTKDFRVNVRVIAATHRNLQEMVAQGLFREDLYYRLNIFLITLPPLRERMEDLPALIQHFITKFNAELSKEIQGISSEALQKMVVYSWPGNIRELENKIKQGMIMARGVQLLPEDISIDPLSGSPGVKPMGEAKREFEKNYLIGLLQKTDGNIARAARLAGKERKDFYEALKRHKIQPHSFRAE